jgi:N-methylhydantoinase B
VRLETPGGGGFGDPFARDAERVARDVRFGYISRGAAEQDYRVVLSQDGSVDIGATALART